MKVNIKSHGDKGTIFFDKEILEVDSNQTNLAVISLNSAFKIDENYYSLPFLKETKYIETKAIRQITQNVNFFSSN